MANKTALCRECQCVIAANAVAGHMDWHAKLHKAILQASGMFTPEEVEQIQARSRLALEGKITVVW